MKETLQSPVTLSTLAIAAFITSPVHAQPMEVMFLDGGYAEMCSAAARSVGQPGSIQITGSRLGVPPLDICNKAISGEDNGPQVLASNYNNRGVLRFAEGSLEAALQDFDESIRIADLAQAHANRGYTLSAMKRFADSISAFDRGIALGTTEIDKAYFNRGIAHEETGNVRQAYYDYLKASEINPVWEEPKNELARFTVTRK